jgi:hypothetical protein
MIRETFPSEGDPMTTRVIIAVFPEESFQTIRITSFEQFPSGQLWIHCLISQFHALFYPPFH